MLRRALALVLFVAACDDVKAPPLPPMIEGTSLPPLPAPLAPRTFPRPGTRITPYVIEGFPEARTPGPGAAAVPPVLLDKLPAGPGFAHEGTAESFSLNRTRVLAFTSEPPPTDPAAVIILVPGLLAGASSFVELGTALVELGEASGQRVIVLAVDRRSNFLEDSTGLAVALQAGDPTIAAKFHGVLGLPQADVAGRTFRPIEGQDALFVAEWGLDVHLRDLREVVKLAIMLGNRAPIFLGGHSFGATMVTAYAAYDFAPAGEPPDPGHVDLAGLLFLDGAPSPREDGTEATRAAAAQSFLLGGAGFGGLPGPGLNDLRTAPNPTLMPSPWLEVPGILDRSLLWTLGVAGLGALHAPERVVAATLPSQLGNAGIANEEIHATYEALLGVALDDDLAPFGAFRFSLGFVEEPATHARTPARPDDANPTGLHELVPNTQATPYRWLSPAELSAATPDAAFPALGSEEPCELETVAQAMVLAPGFDFLEPHFPLRLLLDAQLAAELGWETSLVSNGDYTDDGGAEAAAVRFGDPPLKVTQLGGVELPILIVRGSDGIYPGGDEALAAFAPLARALPSVRGELGPRLNADGSYGPGLEIETFTPYTHNDVLLARDASAVPARIHTFLARWR